MSSRQRTTSSINASLGNPYRPPPAAHSAPRPDGTRTRYRITRAEIVDHRALRLARYARRPTLTLVTCYPFDAFAPSGPLRYVVVA